MSSQVSSSDQFTVAFLKSKGSKEPACVHAFNALCDCMCIWSHVCGVRGAWLTAMELVASRACGWGRQWEMEGVKSSVWGICQRSVVDCGDHWDVKGGRTQGWEGERLLGAWWFDHEQNGCSSCTHKHTHTSLLLHLFSQDPDAQPSRGCVQSPMIIRLSSSLAGSARSFVSGIMTGRIRAPALEPLQAFKRRRVKKKQSGWD